MIAWYWRSAVAPAEKAAMSPADENGLEIAIPGIEPGMNFISVDFDLVMVNRTSERLYAKPVAALLGKKCYREFEKREEPCPHCPGRLALATGQTHETEAIALHDDGTRLYARIRAHPVVGPGNRPAGFIEVVEDISEQKRAESLAYIEADLQAALVSAKNAQKALRETVEAALRIEGLDWGCVFLIDRRTGKQELVLQRGVSPEHLEVLAAVSRGEPDAWKQRGQITQSLPEVVPILYRGSVVATLMAGAAVGSEVLPTTRAGLRGLGSLAGNTIARIWAEQSRGDAVADLEAFIAIAPVATWVIDLKGRVTMWNKAAEGLFGWQSAEVVGRTPPFGPVQVDQGTTTVADKEGRPVAIHVMTMPFRDVVGDSSTTLVIAESLTATASQRGGDEPAGTPARDEAKEGPGHAQAGPDAHGSGVLVLDAGETWGLPLARILSDQGYVVTRCRSSFEAGALLAGSEAEGQSIALAVVGMISGSGLSGLDEKAALRALGLDAQVIVCSDSDVRGYEQHGIAGVIKQPFDEEAVISAVRTVLGRSG
ncbi:MAG: hypothetical protein A2133_09365 [Actinobacteria bacterium RBG_16_64_13]|nr:MAG: hypothetical protein A2133_09365 [Actinobacteria bacterium RBG_16_64_13]